MQITQQSIKIRVENSITSIALVQTYQNSTYNPIEAVYNLPQDEDSGLFVAGLKVTLEDKTIEGRVMEKEKAKEKYDDAVASGKAAVLLKEKKESLQINVGNVLPGQTIIVDLQLLGTLKIEGGAYSLCIPKSYFP